MKNPIRYVKVPVHRKKLSGKWQSGESRKDGKRGTRRKILISPRVKGVTELSTLIHEAIHQIDHRLSERTVRQLERAMVYLVIDNPDLFQKLYKRVN